MVLIITMICIYAVIYNRNILFIKVKVDSSAFLDLCILLQSGSYFSGIEQLP